MRWYMDGETQKSAEIREWCSWNEGTVSEDSEDDPTTQERNCFISCHCHSENQFSFIEQTQTNPNKIMSEVKPAAPAAADSDEEVEMVPECDVNFCDCDEEEIEAVDNLGKSFRCALSITDNWIYIFCCAHSLRDLLSPTSSIILLFWNGARWLGRHEVQRSRQVIIVFFFITIATMISKSEIQWNKSLMNEVLSFRTHYLSFQNILSNSFRAFVPVRLDSCQIEPFIWISIRSSIVTPPRS